MSNDPRAGAPVAVRLMAAIFFLGCVGLGYWSAQLWKKLVAAETQVAELKGRAGQAATADALQAQNESLQARIAQLEAAQRQAAATPPPAAEPAKPANGMAALGALASQMMNTPAMRERLLQTQRRTIETRFAELMNQLGLSPQDRTRLVDLLLQKQMNMMDIGVKVISGGQGSDERAAAVAAVREANAPIDSQIRDFFGGDTASYAAYQDYLAQQPVRTQVTALGASLSTAGLPLSPEQSSALTGVVAEARRNRSTTRDPNDPTSSEPPTRMSPAAMEAYIHDQEQMENQIADRSAAFLSPEQVAALRQAQAARLNQARSSLELARQMMGAAGTAK